jgi:uncharacterized membrane-anchored protein
MHLAQGELAEAERTLAAHAATAAAPSIQSFWTLAALVDVRLQQGRFSEALQLAEEGLRQHAATGMFYAYPRPVFLCARAEALAALGQTEAARAAFREARDDILARADKIADPEYRRTFLEDVPINVRILINARAALADPWP